MFAGFGTAEDTNQRFHEILARRRRRPVDRVRPADADGPRLRRPVERGRGRQVRRRRRHARRHGGPLRRHRPRQGHDVDDDQLAGGGDLRDVRRRRREDTASSVPGSAARCRTTSSRSTTRRRSSCSRREPSMRLVRDTIAFCAAEMPRWHPISISGYHIREAGSTAAQELAFTLANGFAYVELRSRRRARRRRVRAAAQLLLQRPHRLLRGDRQVPRRPAHLGAVDARSLRRASTRSTTLRFHTQTAGVSLTAQQPEVNIARTAIEALAGVLGGTQSAAHQLDGRGARAADREGGAHRAAHPAGDRARDRRGQRRRPARRLVVRRGADRRDRAAGRGDLRPPRRARRRLDAAKACTPASTNGWFQGADRRRGLRVRAEGQRRPSRGRRRQRVHRRQRRRRLDILQITAEQEQQQIKRLQAVRADRDGEAVAAALGQAARRGRRPGDAT